MNNNYTPTSNASGIIQAPKEARYFIQRMSRQGKSAGFWIFIEALTAGNSIEDLDFAKSELDMLEKRHSNDQFRIQLAEVFI